MSPKSNFELKFSQNHIGVFIDYWKLDFYYHENNKESNPIISGFLSIAEPSSANISVSVRPIHYTMFKRIEKNKSVYGNDISLFRKIMLSKLPKIVLKAEIVDNDIKTSLKYKDFHINYWKDACFAFNLDSSLSCERMDSTPTKKNNKVFPYESLIPEIYSYSYLELYAFSDGMLDSIAINLSKKIDALLRYLSNVDSKANIYPAKSVKAN